MASLGVTATTAQATTVSGGRWAWAAGCLVGLGATLGIALDHLHVASGTTSYALPFLFGQAWWAFPVFALAPVPLGLGRPVAERLLRVPIAPPSWGTTVVAMALFISAYMASSLLPGGALVRGAALAATFLVTWWVADRRVLGLVLAATAAVCGTAAEALLVAAGEFSYPDADLLGVAGWLPLLYATAAVAVGALGSRLVDGGPSQARSDA